MSEPVDRLALDDSAGLSALDGTAFAPHAPRWLDSPGFWDECRVAGRTLAPGFSIAVVDADARVVPLKLVSRRGTPAELVAEYRLANGMTATEVRSVHPGGVFVSEWRLRALKPAVVHLVAWTVAPAAAVAASSVRFDGALDWMDAAARRHLSLAALGESTSWVAVGAGALDLVPRWDATPLPQLWAGERLPSVVHGPARAAETLWCLAVHRRLRVGDAGGTATFALRAVAETAMPPVPVTPSPGHTLAGASRAAWNAALATVPRLTASDPFLEVAWERRWGGLWQHAERAAKERTLLTVRAGAGHEVELRALPVILRELVWLDSARAQALVVHALAQQRRDGALPAVDGATSGPDSSPADWGAAVRALDDVDPNDAWVRAIHPPLGDLANWTLVHAEAAAEAAADEPSRADAAVHAGVCAWRLARWLEDAAERAGVPEQSGRWRDVSARAGALASRALGGTLVLRGPAANAHASALPFVVLGTDIPTREQVGALTRALLDPDRFWTPYPIPARALGDADALWRSAEALGDRNIPDAARVIPWLTCAIGDAMLAQSGDMPELRAALAQLVVRFVRMHFADGDLRRPVASGDFNPLTGDASPSLDAAGDQHTSLADLILRVALGIRPHASGIRVDPLPLGIDRIEVTGLRVRGRTLAVRVDALGVTATVDGAEHHAAPGVALDLNDAE